MKNQKGTTLVEVLVAVVLLGICGTGFLWGMTNVTRTTPVVDDRSTALSVAESQMEFIRNQPYSEPIANGGEGYQTLSAEKIPKGYFIDTPMAFPLDADWSGGPDQFIQKLEVRVWVPQAGGGQDIVVTLEEYRAQ